MTHNEEKATLLELLDWLVGMENLAHDVYTATSEALALDPVVSAFIARLADNEREHAGLMAAIREHVGSREDLPPPDICLDASLREAAETPLRRLLAEAKAGTILRKRAIAIIAAIEFTEWNDVFLYALSRYGIPGRKMQMAAARIQEHERDVESFIAGLPRHLRPDQDLAMLPKVWNRRVLLVDDSAPLRDLLAGLLKSVGRVSVAEDGGQALTLMRDHYFDAVVTDMRMPGVGGIEFQQRAVAEYPDQEGRFLFMSFDPGKEDLQYLCDHDLPFLEKPCRPEQLTQTVREIMDAPHTVS